MVPSKRIWLSLFLSGGMGWESFPARVSLFILPTFSFFFQVRSHHLRIVFTNATSRQVLLAARKNNSFRLKLFPMNIASAKSKRTGTKALCVHNAMAGRDRVAGIFVEGVTHIAAQIAVSYQAATCE